MSRQDNDRKASDLLPNTAQTSNRYSRNVLAKNRS